MAMINYLFRCGPGPLPFDDQGDVDGDAAISVADMVYLIKYLRNPRFPPPVDKNRFLPTQHVTPQGDTLNYQDMFKRPGLVDDSVWRSLVDFVLP